MHQLKIIEELNIQKKDLGMSNAVIAQRSGVSEPTVTRILSGKHPSAHFDHVMSIAAALGVDVSVLRKADPEVMRHNQAVLKARQIMRLVRGNSALEATKTSKEAFQRMLNKTINELMAGSKRALWR
jgi:transcriptional regulator with XRE-family HTH domain